MAKAIMNNLMYIWSVFALAINVARGGGTANQSKEADAVAKPELKILEASAVRPKRRLEYYDDDEYTTDDAWRITARQYNPVTQPYHPTYGFNEYSNTQHPNSGWKVCSPGGANCASDRNCCTRSCPWFTGNTFKCTNGICPFPDGTYRPCLPTNTDQYVVENNYFSPNYPIYPPKGYPVTPWYTQEGLKWDK